MTQATKPRILESKTICRQEGRYIGWPTIAKTAEGELLAVFSGDRDQHVCPFGKTCLVRSTDTGRTWSAPEIINDTPLDDRDAGICVASDGTIVVSWFTSHYNPANYLRMCHADAADRWQDRIAAVTPADLRQWAGEDIENGRHTLGHWTRRSLDGGHTWETPVRTPGTNPHGPIQLGDGRLLSIGIGTIHGRDKKHGAILVGESTDQAASWTEIGQVHMFPDYTGSAPDGYAYLCEPHVVETRSGRLVGIARYEEKPRDPGHSPCELWQFTSDDGGRTWTQPAPTKFHGKPPHLIRLRDDRLLLSYGYRHEPYGERVCFSRDDGATWDYATEVILRDDAPSGDLGYPASVQLDDGTILTVYYQQEAAGEMTRLMTTHWHPGT